MRCAQNAGLTLHVETLYGDNNHHICESCFKGLARALRQAIEIDPRKADAVPSTKGVLEARCERRGARTAASTCASTCAGRRSIRNATSTWSRKGSAGPLSSSRSSGRCGAGCGWWRPGSLAAEMAVGATISVLNGDLWTQTALSLGFAVLVGMFGNDLKRWTLFRRGYLEVAVVTGDDPTPPNGGFGSSGRSLAEDLVR